MTLPPTYNMTLPLARPIGDISPAAATPILTMSLVLHALINDHAKKRLRHHWGAEKYDKKSNGAHADSDGDTEAMKIADKIRHGIQLCRGLQFAFGGQEHPVTAEFLFNALTYLDYYRGDLFDKHPPRAFFDSAAAHWHRSFAPTPSATATAVATASSASASPTVVECKLFLVLMFPVFLGTRKSINACAYEKKKRERAEIQVSARRRTPASTSASSTPAIGGPN